MNWRFSILAVLLLVFGLGGGAQAQIPGLPGVGVTETTAKEPAADAAPGDTTADVAALDRIIRLLQDDGQRAAFLQSLSEMRDGLLTQGPSLPDADDEPPTEGLIGAVADNVSRAFGDFPGSALGASPDRKLETAGAELQARYDMNFGGMETVDFLSWALPGVALVAGVLVLFFKHPWLVRRRRLRRTAQTRMQLLRRVSVRLIFDLLPWLGAVVTIGVWTSVFSTSWRDTQLFLALTSPFVVPVLVRQITSFGLLLLGRSRGWRLVDYAHARLLPWVVTLTSVGVVAGLMREFAVRSVLGRNVSDIAALTLDLVVGGLTVLFALRHRRTIRGLIVKGRAKGHDHGSGILANVVRALGRFWHVFAILFVIANVGARLFGIGGGNFFGDALIAVAYIVAGLAFLAVSSEYFGRWRTGLGRGRSTARRALTRRYLGVFHIVLQIVTTAVVGVACIDLWGFGIADWMATTGGAQVMRPLSSILMVPLAVWLIWITVDTLISHALSPVDNFGRQRLQSARIKTLLPLLRNFVFAALAIITVIAVLANIGVNVAPLLAGAGIIGIAISFGSQQLVQDVITGFFFLFEDALAIGDSVNVGTQAGIVESINIRSVKIRAGDGSLYSVPFSQIKALQNSSRDYGIFLLTITIGFTSDADRAMAIMREIGDAMREEAPWQHDMLAPVEIWGVDGFTADGTVIKGAIRCRPLQQWGVGREFNRRLKQRFDAEEIVLFRPKQVVEMINGDPRETQRPQPDATRPRIEAKRA